MAAASCATALALAASGLASRPQGSLSCSARLSTPVAVSVLPFPLVSGKALQYSSGSLFGDASLRRGSELRLVHSHRNAAAGVRAAAVGTVTKEPATGIEFPNTVSGATTELSLVGAGVREKQIAFLKVKVYAVGFYIESTSLAGSMGSWKSKAGSDLAKDEAFFKAIVEAPLEKALKIVLARDIEGSQFWGALDEALTPRLKSVGADAAGQEALATFGQVFKDRALKQGTAVLLTWTQPSTLKIFLSSQGSSPSSAPDATVESAPLLSCLFDVYLGKDAVSPSARASIASGFPSLL